jgi:radical SAM superfamily enzyme YgiQ (UPF0313 family)
MKILFVYSIFESIGIEYLSAVLKDQGHKTRLLFDPRLLNTQMKDFSSSFVSRKLDRKKRLVQEAVSWGPDLIAFSVVAADYLWAQEMAGLLKSKTDAPIVFGGNHPTACPEEVLQRPEIDFVIQGEGEHALAELANALEKGRDPTNILNVWSKIGGKITRNELRPLITDLDALPWPDRDLYRRHGTPFDVGQVMLGRRGCAFSCPFCEQHLLKKLYRPIHNDNKSFVRRRDPILVTEEVKEAAQNGVRLFSFNDEDFLENLPWLSRFAENITGTPARLKVFTNPRSVNVQTADLLVKCGVRQVEMGVQSVEEKTRRRLKRPLPTEHITTAIRLLRERNIIVTTDNIIGFPWEGRRQWEDLIDFYLENPVDFINFFWLLLLPGYEIVDMFRDEGLLTDDEIRDLTIAPWDGNVSSPQSFHAKDAVQFKDAVDAINYLPQPIAKFVIRTGLHRLLGFARTWKVVRAIHLLMVKPGDNFPHPRECFELWGMRDALLVRNEFSTMARNFPGKMAKSFTGITSRPTDK